MERHPAGCDPSAFTRRQHPQHTTHRQDLLSVPGIQSALSTLETVASDVVQPLTRYNRHTYLNRFHQAANHLVDVFITHINHVRRQEIRANSANHAATTPPYQIRRRRVVESDQDSDEDSDLEIRKRSSRLAKRPRPKYTVDDDEYYPARRSLPRRSKHVANSYNDDLAYSIMARSQMPPSPPHYRRRVVLSESDDESEEEEEDYDQLALHLVKNPREYVRKRPLGSDLTALTPVIRDDDDDTDTEQRRRNLARLSLKAAIYGPGNCEFTEKELRTVFPGPSKRRLKQDFLVKTSMLPPPGYIPDHGLPWRPPRTKLCPIPKDMIARYIRGTYWLSPRPELPEFDVFQPLGEGFLLSKQRFLSVERDANGDSGKASPATNVQSGSSSTGSLRAEKVGLQNGHIEELGPSLSTMFDTQQCEQKTGKERDVSQKKNGKVHDSVKSRPLAWKDLAPYGKVPPLPPPLPPLPPVPQPKLPVLQSKLAPQHSANHMNNPTTTAVLKNMYPQNVNHAPSKKLEAPTISMRQGMTRNARTQEQPPRANAQSSSVSKPIAPRPPQVVKRAQAKGLFSPAVSTRVQTPDHSPPKSAPLPASPPCNQLTVVPRGSSVSNIGMHHPQVSIQPQQAILTAVPVQISSHQAGITAQQALQLHAYGQDPRLVSQWQLQNNTIQQIQGTLQLSPGLVGVNSVMNPQLGSVPAQSRIVPVQTSVPITTNALAPAGTTMRPDTVSIQANGVSVQEAVEPTQRDLQAPSSEPSSRQGNFNSQLQQQYQRHYDEMYSKHYQEQMKTLERQ